jgi:pilus assembly protein Flp/PilA
LLAGTGREESMTAIVKQLWNDESGATAVEYGLMVALIAVAIIAAVGAVGDSLNTIFGKVSTKLDEVP